MHYSPWTNHAWWVLRPFLLSSASWPKLGPGAVFLHACLSVPCPAFPSGIALSWLQGLPGKVVRSFLEYFFWICLCFFLFFLSFSCPCSPCITTSRDVVPAEGLPGYQLCRIHFLHMSSFSEVLQSVVILLPARYKHDCSCIWGFVREAGVCSALES